VLHLVSSGPQAPSTETVKGSEFPASPGLLWEGTGKRAHRLGILAAGFPIIVYVVAMLVADSLPTLSLVLYFIVPLLYFGLVAVLQTAPKTKAAAQDLS
jgi:hypothetical protein